jgi:hypothetical protein
VHIQDESVEEHAFSFRDSAPDRADLAANLEIFVKPVLGIPNGDFGVLCGVGIGIHSLNLLDEM